MGEKKKILVACFSDLKRDQRVRRQLLALRDRHQVVAAGYADPELEGVEYHRITRDDRAHGNPLKRLRKIWWLKSGQEERFYWDADVRAFGKWIAGEQFDAIIANDLDMVPVAVESKGGARVLFDAHEYYPAHFGDQWKWRFLFSRMIDAQCRTYLKRLDGMITVSEGIAERWAADWQIPRPPVVINAAPYAELQPTPVEPGQIRMVYHGVANASRGLENLILAMAQLSEQYSLDLVCISKDEAFTKKLRDLAAQQPRVRILDPIPSNELLAFGNRYDLGLVAYPSVNFNQKNALPNKFFEYLQSRLAIVGGESVEMGDRIRQYDLGVAIDQFSLENLVAALQQVDAEKLRRWKVNSHVAAQALSWEQAQEVLVRQVEKLLEPRG